jgi:hypothetical protein
MIHMRIMTMDEGAQLVADCPEWDAPVPRVGDYIFHPPLPGRSADPNAIAGGVKAVKWRTHERQDDGSEFGRFVQASAPYVELWI